MKETTRVLGTALTVLSLAGGGAAMAQQADAGAITMDFEMLEAGEIVSEVPHLDTGLMIRIQGINPAFSQNSAVIFDSCAPGLGDVDLGSPHRDFETSGVPGPGEGDGGRRGSLCQNDMELGKLLIVDDDLSPMTDDGRVAVPDDEGQAGGRLLIDFAELGPVTIHDMTVIDIEEPDAVVWFYDVGTEERRLLRKKKHILARYRVHTEDNGVARLFDPEIRSESEEDCHVTLLRRKRGEPLEPVIGVRSIEVDFSGSGAIARIVYSASTPS